MAHRAGYQAPHRIDAIVLAVLLLGLVLWLAAPRNLPRINHIIQDGVEWLRPPVKIPGIVIVAIDEKSIDAIGRWPWRRALHAQVLQSVSHQGPQAIGIDILFNEEELDYPADDLLLAQAIALSGRVALPVAQYHPGSLTTRETPLPLFAQAAAQLGHVQMHVDSDGLVRSFYLQGGPSSAPLPHLALAMQCAAGLQLPTCHRPPAPPSTVNDWVEPQLEYISYVQGSPPFTTYSYIDVLRGQIPQDAFKDQYVLIGATAAGVGNMLSAPAGLRAQRVPNVELLAHILSGELQGIHIRAAPAWINCLFNIIPVALAFWALMILSPSMALAASAALAVLMLLFTAAAPPLWSIQLAPAAGLLVLASAYPLWSWRQLSASAHFLHLEMQDLREQGLHVTLEADGYGSGDFLGRRIHAVERASRQLRDLHYFVSESLQQLPSPTLVCDTRGTILLANAAADRYAASINQATPLPGKSLTHLLSQLKSRDSGEALVTRAALNASYFPTQSEGQDSQGRTILLLAKPFSASTIQGWLVSLVDITDMRQLMWQRDQALHFISHDIRAPIASIVTLLEMYREYPGQMPQEELMARIERYAQTSLGIAENFIHLARAKSQAYQSEPVDLAALLEEAADDAWATAHAREVHIALSCTTEPALCMGDRALLSRALGNVLGNAIKYSPANSTVHCTIEHRPAHCVVSVRDGGPGIPPDQRARLFEPFQRLHLDSYPAAGGAGLGLALVHTVVQRHGGSIELDSTMGAGSTFRLVFPRFQN